MSNTNPDLLRLLSFVVLDLITPGRYSNHSEPSAFFDIWLSYPVNAKGNLSLALYDDDEIEHGEDSLWDRASKGKCDGDWRGLSKMVHDIQPHDWKYQDGRKIYQDRFEFYEIKRPHFWFLALVACDTVEPEVLPSVNYHIHAVQAQMTEWNNEFSFEWYGINTLYLVYTVSYILLAAVQLYAVKQYHDDSGAHHIVKLLSISIFLQAFASMLMFINYSHYSVHGEEIRYVKFISQELSVGATTAFLLLLLLISQGWTINSNIVVGGRYILTIVFCVFNLQFFLVIWKHLYESRKEVRYQYASAPSLLVAISFCAVGIVFIYFSRNSWRREVEHDKATLFKTIAAAFSLWFFAPVISLMIAMMLSPWVRDICIAATWESATFTFLSMMTFLLWPSRAEKYFEVRPYGTQRHHEYDLGNIGADYVRLPEENL